MFRVFARSLAGLTSLALLTSVVHASVASAAPPTAADEVSAESSVVAVAARQVSPQVDLARGGTGLPGAVAAEVTWPSAGTGRVEVPGEGKPAVRVSSTAVSVAMPGDRGRGGDLASAVEVMAYDRWVASRLGGHGTAFRLVRADGGDRAAKVGVRVDVSGFARAFGGGFESRLRLSARPACALETPDAVECAARRVPSHVDLTAHALVADVQPDAGTVFVVVAAPSGEEGSATATTLASSSKWSVGLQSGAFSWSYPLPKVGAVSGDAPDFNLGYSSQAVDGLTAAENAQPSWVGLGWDLATPFVERRYNGCTDDGGDTGDLCFAGDQLMLSLEGTSSELVRDEAAGGDVWRAKQDPGWRVERHRGADNGDDDGEYWVVATPQGTKYTLGRGAQPTTGADTDSVFTVPVFGDDDGEPCHESDIEDSWCQQAWRWNLDGVEDAHGNSTTYFYTKETNRYARNGNPDRSTDYVRGGHVRHIDYSQRAGDEDVTAPARLAFTTGLRCIEAAGGTGTCPAFDADHATSYPDVPLDQLCTDRCTGDEQKSPTFFTGMLLRSVAAQRSEAAAFVDVDRVDFSYSFPEPSDGTSASLWLERFQQHGLGGDGEAALPAVVISGRERANRVDAAPELGVPFLRKLRITSVVDELGRRVDVDYTQPQPCPIDDFPEGRADTNTQNCYPAWRSNDQSAGFGWWHKYLVTRVTVTDQTGGSPQQATEYRYGGDPAWHYDDDDVTPSERKTWSDWRGYGSVDVAHLSGSLTRSLFFRGMDGDRLAGGGTKSVSVTDSQGTSLPDSPWLRGKTRENRQLAADGSYELGGSLHGYTSAHTTPAEPGQPDPDDDAHLVVENSSVKRETVIADPGGQRSTRTTRLDTTFDTYGQPTSVLDVGDGPNDTRCTTTSYARDDATVDSWMLAFPFRVRSHAGTCQAPTALLTGKDLYYDGSSTLGAAPVRGDVTRSVAAVAASDPNTVTESVTTSATFDALGRTLTETDGNGGTSTTAYAPATGRPATVTETNALGHVEVTTLDPDRQQPTAVRDANGRTTTNNYDPLGRLISVRTPEQAVTDPPSRAFEYDLDADHTRPPKITTRQLQSGTTYVSSWAFLDSLGRERQSQQISPASGRAIVTDTRYDDAGRVAAKTLPVVVEATAGAGLVDVPADAVDEVRHSYDVLSRPVRSAQFASDRELWATTTAYFGDHARVVPPPGGVETTAWTDVRGRSIRKVEGTGPGAVTTSYTYTAADQVATVTDPGGHRSTFAYDLLRRPTDATDPDAGRSRTRHDANGNVIASWDAKTLAGGGTAPTLSMDYDALNRPTTRWAGVSGTGRRLAAWSYDSTSIPNGIGRAAAQTTIDDGRSYTQDTVGYDAKGRVTGHTWTFPTGVGGLLGPSSYTVGYGYDAADHMVTLTYSNPVLGAPAETVTTGYDALGNPTTLTGTLTDPLTGHVSTVPYVSGTGYAADGKLGTRDYADPLFPLRRAYAYEPDTQRLSRVRTTAAGHTRQDDAYRWDPAGNTTSITDTALPTPVATCFTYDGLNRLTHGWTTRRTDCSDSGSTTVHDGPAGFNQSWTYAPDGNLTSARSLGSTKTYTYGDPAHPHAVTRAGGESFDYDANGAMRRRSALLLATTMSWNAEQRLESVTSTLVARTRFVYLPDGTRMARIDPLGTATLYIPGQEITVLLGLVQTAIRFYSHAGTTVAQRTLGLGVLTWQLNDTQGSAQISAVAGTGLLARTYYTPYGDIRPLSAPPPTEHGFLGMTKDPTTGLNALGARYYDAGIGRFLSTDPASDQRSAQAANPYSYAANNPILYMDPTGLWSISGAWNSVKEAASDVGDWVSENKGLVTEIAVGIGVGIAIGAVCATGVGCLILAGVAAGAAGAAAGYGVDVAEGKNDFSWGGLATSAGIGAASGLLGAGIGKALGAGVKAAAGTTAGKAVTAAASKTGAAAANTARAATAGARSAGNKVAAAAKSVGRGGCRGNSFTPETPVLMADGTHKAIALIAVGDLVLATDPETGRTEAEPVTDLITGEGTKNLVTITVLTNTVNGATDTIVATDGHPFWVQSEHRWVDAKDLRPGTLLRTAAGTYLQTTAVRTHATHHRVHNLTVADLHTYYVLAGSTPVLVHNSGPCPEAGLKAAADAADEFASPGGMTGHAALGDGTTMNLSSGRGNLPAGYTAPPGATVENFHHLEAQVAASMHASGNSSATLYITGNYGACKFCVRTLRQMLPEGARLSVVWRAESGAIRNRTFIGGAD